MLEKMGAFFEARLDGYEEHMLKNIQAAEEFYPFTAELLPEFAGAQVLDLGCGTGLELNWYFRQNPKACVTGIDLSEKMLEVFRKKFPEQELKLVWEVISMFRWVRRYSMPQCLWNLCTTLPRKRRSPSTRGCAGR